MFPLLCSSRGRVNKVVSGAHVAQSLAGSQPFVIAGTPLARDNAVIEAGVDLVVSPAATLGLAYQGQLAAGAQDHGVRANLALRF